MMSTTQFFNSCRFDVFMTGEIDLTLPFRGFANTQCALISARQTSMCFHLGHRKYIQHLQSHRGAIQVCDVDFDSKVRNKRNLHGHDGLRTGWSRQ